MKCNLEEICEYVKGKVNISTLNKQNYISTENMLPNKEGIVSSAALPTTILTQAYYKGDVLVSNIRPYFKKIWFANQNGGCSNDVLVFRAKENIDSLYLHYVLSDDKFFDYATATSKGTKMPRGDKQAILKYEVRKIPLDIQQKIASILSALDDKIALNRKINENLEAQAQAVYKSWFIDFEPFGGSMPSNWKKSNIYSIANIIYGAPFASKKFNIEGNGKPIIRIRDLKNQEFTTYTTEVHKNGYLLQAGDIVVGMDGEFRPYIWGNNEAWLNQRVSVFENKRPLGKFFLYYTIKPLLYSIEQTQVATTVIHIGKKDFDKFSFYLPDDIILEDFDKLTTPIFRQIVSKSFENRKLAALRDTLLPRLMSGEIDVANIDI